MTKRTHAMAMQTKKRILNAALELFSEKGYDKTSLSDIARKAGVTRGAVYWHFEDKGELLLELCHTLAQENKFTEYMIAGSRDTEPDPLGCLKRWLKLHGGANAVQLFSSVITSIVDDIVFSYGDEDQDVKDRFRELFKNRLYYIKETLKNAVRRQQLSIDSDIDLMAEVLHSFLIGYYHAIKSDMHVNLTKNFDLVVDSMFDSLTNMKTTASYKPYYM